MTYTIGEPEYPTEWVRLGLIYNGKEVGWIRYAKAFNPIVYIYDKTHGICKQELSEILRHYTHLSGDYFLVTENISYDDVAQKEAVCFLSKNCQQEKIILDATAGNRMMWFDKHNPDVLFIDQRPEVQPDQVADFRSLEYPNDCYNLVVFDPPHIIDSQPTNNRTGMLSDFGSLQKETWQSDIKRGFSELFRVLKPGGFLIFKWSNQQISSDKLIALSPYQPLFYQITCNKKREKSHSNYQTLWFCFMKPLSVMLKESSVQTPNGAEK